MDNIKINPNSQLHQAVMAAIADAPGVAAVAKAFLEGRGLDPERWQLLVEINLQSPLEPVELNDYKNI